MKKESPKFQPTLLDRTFEISVVLKGLDGVLEVIGGLLLLVMSPATINRLFDSLARNDIIGSHQLLTHYVQELNNYVVGGTLFAALYLLAHGVVKIVLVIAVLRRQLWAYPVMIFFLAVFILYQAYLLVLGYSTPLLLLTIFDLFVVWLTLKEYEKLKERVARTHE
jgi:uncharacterized membrane protein